MTFPVLADGWRLRTVWRIRWNLENGSGVLLTTSHRRRMLSKAFCALQLTPGLSAPILKQLLPEIDMAESERGVI